MPLESATYIDGLVTTNPAASDAISTADDHLRLIKSAIKATFPNITGPLTLSQAQIAPLASPEFTGIPKAPTAALGTNTTQLASTAFVQAALATVYPIGSIYINATNGTNPASLLGFGTWVAFGAGRVPVGFNAGDPLFDTAEETGGSKDAIVVSHNHTATSTSTVTDPGHRHDVILSEDGLSDTAAHGNGSSVLRDGITSTNTTGITVATTTTVASTGSSGTNANLQPYITVYMWKRTA